MDGRRRQWISADVYYADSNLGIAIRDNFGGIGLLVFDLFLRACKRSPVEGQLTYSSLPDFLAQLGIPALPLVDEAGETWELDALWTLLARHKNVRRTSRGRLTTVKATHWERWQRSRSDGKNTDKKQTDSAQQKRHDSDKDKDSDNPPKSPQGKSFDLFCDKCSRYCDHGTEDHDLAFSPESHLRAVQ